MIDFLSKGGVLVVPILFCSMLALAIFMERVIRFARMGVRDQDLAKKIASHIEDGEDQQAHEIASNSKAPMARILTQAMEVREQDRETLETVIIHATDEEVRELSRYLQALATIHAERAEYGWMLPSTRARARLLKPGTMVVSQPAIPLPLVVDFPFPPWATRKEEVVAEGDPFEGL